jgi:hypothetical protein
VKGTGGRGVEQAWTQKIGKSNVQAARATGGQEEHGGEGKF